MTRVVLCASFPSGARAGSVTPYYSTDIALAVVAISEAALRSNCQFIFGAHPTISPIVLHTARLLDAGNLVTIYQSEFFTEVTTDAVRTLSTELGAELRTVPSGQDRSTSLTAMRRAMFSDVPPDAVFFCGGMDGLDEEYEFARITQAQIYFVTEPGGRTAQLATEVGNAQTILRGRAYGSLALASLEASGASDPLPSGPMEDEMYESDSTDKK